jgi:hypothetical protein
MERLFKFDIVRTENAPERHFLRYYFIIYESCKVEHFNLNVLGTCWKYWDYWLSLFGSIEIFDFEY